MPKDGLRQMDLFKWLSWLVGGWLLWRFVHRQSRALSISRRQTVVFSQIACDGLLADRVSFLAGMASLWAVVSANQGRNSSQRDTDHSY